MFSDDGKDFVSTLDAGGKNRTQSLSNVDIFISPCDPDHKHPHTCPSPPQVDQKGDGLPQKSRLEAAVSLRLDRSRVMQHSLSPNLGRRKSTSSIACSPGLQEQERGNYGNSEEEGLLVDEGRMYPTLRSKSLSTNPRKTRRQEDEEKPRMASSVKDLVSVFGEQQANMDQDQVQVQRP